MLLQFTSIYAVRFKETTTTLHCYSVRFVLHLIAPQPSPPAGPEQVGDSCPPLSYPHIIVRFGRCLCLCLCFCPCSSLRPRLRLFPYPRFDPPGFIAETTTIIPYHTVLCCAFCSGLLFPSNCTHLQRNTRASTPRHVNPPSPSRSSKAAHNSTTRHGTSQHHNTATFGVILCCCSRKPSGGVSLATRHRAPQLARHRHSGRQ